MLCNGAGFLADCHLAQAAAKASTDTGELKGVPALPRCRVRLVWEEDDTEVDVVRRQVRVVGQ